MGGGLRALAAARPLRPALRLRLGRWRLPASAHGTAGRVHAGADRRHSGGQEGAAWVPGRRAGKRPELARTAGRFEGAWSDDRAGTGHWRWLAWLLEGARGGVADDPALKLPRSRGQFRAWLVAVPFACPARSGWASGSPGRSGA